VRTLSALAFRRKFGSVLDEVVRKRQPITVTRANRPLVVLVPADEYARGAGPGAARESRLRLAADRLAEWRRRHATRLLDLDPVALVRRDRDNR
jgi:prevent-host-death family protein